MGKKMGVFAIYGQTPANLSLSFYPVREQSINSVNYNAAMSRMGPDNMAVHVFWDK